MLGESLSEIWGTYGIPQYLYTDGGKDFKSQHVEQVATELGIVCCLPGLKQKREEKQGIMLY